MKNKFIFVFRGSLFIIIFNNFCLTLSGQNLNNEFMKLTKDPTTFRIMDNRYLFDSMLFVNNISHPQITVNLVRKIIINPTYCNKYADQLNITNNLDVECLLCLDEIDSKYLENQYPVIYNDKSYRIKIEKLLNSKMKFRY